MLGLVDEHLRLVGERCHLIVDLLQRAGRRKKVLGVVGRVIDYQRRGRFNREGQNDQRQGNRQQDRRRAYGARQNAGTRGTGDMSHSGDSFSDDGGTETGSPAFAADWSMTLARSGMRSAAQRRPLASSQASRKYGRAPSRSSSSISAWAALSEAAQRVSAIWPRPSSNRRLPRLDWQ
ncbi:hypothetical protein D3C80_1237710 [compost metagenome]